MSADAWVTAGAPLPSGDGWRVWYSWPSSDEPELRDPDVVALGARSTGVLEGGWEGPLVPPGSERSMWVRTLRLSDPEPGALYELAFPEQSQPVRWRTWPHEMPEAGLSLLIASCFWLNDDKAGFYADTMEALIRQESPVLKVLMGDQLYMDVWGPLPGPDLSRDLARRYEAYWGNEPYRRSLAACPTVMTPDDHEFWNDFPKPQAHVPFTWSGTLAEAAATTLGLLDAYQSPLNPDGGRYGQLTVPGRQGVPPVSIFFADTRSNRTRVDADDQRLMDTVEWKALREWAAGLTGPGLLIVSQPLFKPGGSRTDSTLVDYEREADWLSRLLTDCHDGRTGDGRPHDILLLTGDIHVGRLSTATATDSQSEVHELVASPAALVTPYLPPWSHKAEPLPTRVDLDGRRWFPRSHPGVPTTVDDNVGLLRLAPGRNGRVRVTVQLWRVRAQRGMGRRFLDHFHRPVPRPGTPMHDPVDLELR